MTPIIRWVLNRVLGTFIGKMVDGFWTYMTGKSLRAEATKAGVFKERAEASAAVVEQVEGDKREGEKIDKLGPAEVREDLDKHGEFRD